MSDSPPPGDTGDAAPAPPQPWFPPAGSEPAGGPPPSPWPPPAGYPPPGPGYGTPPGAGSATPPGAGAGSAPPPGYGQPGYGAPGPWPRYGEATPKPGVIPLRPLGLGEILDGAFAAIRRNPKPVLGIAAAVMTVAAVLTAALSRSLLNVPSPSGQLTTRQAEHLIGQFVSGAIPLLAALVLVAVIVRALLAGLLAPVIAREACGQQISARDAWRAAAPRLPALLAATVLVLLASLAPAAVLAAILGIAALASAPPAALAVIALLGGLVALLATVWIPTMLSLVTPVVVLEGAGAGPSLRRSWRLVRHSFWRVFGILLLAEIIVSVAATILQLPFGFTASALPGVALSTVVSVLGSIAAGTVTQPITAAVTVLLYVDRRMRKEGLDLALRTAAGNGPMDEAGFAAAWRPPAGPAAASGPLPPGPTPPGGPVRPGDPVPPGGPTPPW